MTTNATPPEYPAHPELVKTARFATDMLFGIILPLGCLVFDPVVFRPDSPEFDGGLSAYVVFAYTAAGIGMLTMALWYLIGRQGIYLLGCSRAVPSSRSASGSGCCPFPCWV